MSRLRAVLPLALLAGIGLGACGGGGGAASSSSTSTLPPLPKNVVALVTLAGAGSNVGSGDEVVPVTLPSGAGSPSSGTVPGGNQVIGGKVKVGSYPDAIALNPAGTTAYVANYSSNTITPINLKNDKAGVPIPAGLGPAGIAISPDGKTAYVTDDGSPSVLGHTVTPIDLATGKAGSPIQVGPGPQGIAITPDGKTAYVADAGAIVAGQQGPIGHTVTPINLDTKKPGAPITVGNGPTGVAISPDGSTVFVTNLDSGSVSPISTATKKAAAAIAVPGGPVAVVVAAGAAWVVDTPSNISKGDNVVPISLSSLHAGNPIAVGKGPQDIAFTPDLKTAWVSCLTSNTLVPIDVATKKVGTPIGVGGGPFALAIAQVSA